ncbi:MAG: hypothetical protein WBV11_12080 [Salegentibacter sp.]
MKKLFILMLFLLFCGRGIAQETGNTYLIFEFMKVANDKESAYQDTEDFWEKIHQQRVAAGDIVGWDLWYLLPGGTDQGYQYLTVTVFNDPLKMMQAGNGIYDAAKKAYPDLSEQQFNERMDRSGSSRDLAVRLYFMVVTQTDDDFQMKPGMLASFDLMKAAEGKSADYEKAEGETFLPEHQKQIDSGAKGHWQLLRLLFPEGSDVYASHITVNMFTDMEQFLNQYANLEEPDAQSQQKMDEGIKTRDMKWKYLGTLVKMVR